MGTTRPDVCEKVAKGEEEGGEDVSDEPEGGAKMDALIAARVMGLTIDWEDKYSWYRDDNGFLERVPDYSTDIAAAWQVVEKLAGGAIQFRLEIAGIVRPTIYAKFVDCRLPEYVVGGGSASTAPLAICRAALKAINARTHRQD